MYVLKTSKATVAKATGRVPPALIASADASPVSNRPYSFGLVSTFITIVCTTCIVSYLTSVFEAKKLAEHLQHGSGTLTVMDQHSAAPYY